MVTYGNDNNNNSKILNLKLPVIVIIVCLFFNCLKKCLFDAILKFAQILNRF